MAEKQPRRISVDHYRGGIPVRVNERVAQGFVKAADLRRRVEVVSLKQNSDKKRIKPLEAVRRFRERGTYKIIKTPNAWVIGVRDEKVQAGLEKRKKKYKLISRNQALTQELDRAVAAGLKNILLREKLTNAGEADLMTGLQVIVEVQLLSIAFLTGLAAGLQDYAAAASLGGLTFAVNAGLNLSNWVVTGIDRAGDKIGSFNDRFYKGKELEIRRIRRKNKRHHWDNPFTRHSIAETALPAVPVDRLLRGTWYLRQNKGKLLEQKRTR